MGGGIVLGRIRMGYRVMMRRNTLGRRGLGEIGLAGHMREVGGLMALRHRGLCDMGLAGRRNGAGRVGRAIALGLAGRLDVVGGVKALGNRSLGGTGLARHLRRAGV